MSKYGTFETVFRNEAHLCAALADMGYGEDKIETHADAASLYGYQNDERAEKAHVIIRRNYISLAANDVGFVRGADGTYRAIISEFDRGRFTDTWMGKLKQSYSEHRQMAVAKQKGYIFRGREIVQTEKGETVKLRFVVR